VAAAATASVGTGADSTSGTGAAPAEAGAGGTVYSAASVRSTSAADPGVFFGSRLVAGSASDLALFPCSSFGTSGGDKGNTRHSDPIALRHEPGQGRSAAKSNPEAIVNTILQPGPYLQNNEGNMSK
jgi:hypothetical protein